MMLAIGAVLVAALVVRQAGSTRALRPLLLIAAVAFGMRTLAVTMIHLIAIQAHREGTWLNDEASFYLAAESLLPNPWNAALPQGLGHLGGNGYLGLVTLIALLGQQMDTVAFRLANTALGTSVAVLFAVIAWRLIGERAGLVAGLMVALWPTLILWSATFLRDTLCSFVVVVVWWTLADERNSRFRAVAVATLGVILLASLRPYLAGAAALGVLAWLIWPFVMRQSRGALLLGASGLLALGAAVMVLEAQRVDQAVHELVYRQTTTRLETLGRLYFDVNPSAPPRELPFVPGVVVARVDQTTGWLRTGLIQEPLAPGLVLVAYTDATIQPEQTADLVLLQSAPLVPLQVLASAGPGFLSFLTGEPNASDPNSLVWAADAFAWDALLVLGVLGARRARIAPRQMLFPALVLIGTVAALVAVPGAPGNDDRHRAAQVLPLLVVFATGVLAARPRPMPDSGAPLSNATISPANASTLAASRARSAR